MPLGSGSLTLCVLCDCRQSHPPSFSVLLGAFGHTETTSAMHRLRLPLSSLMVMGRSSLILSMASGQSSCGEQTWVLSLAGQEALC
jgi:hypothetical protein